jgi:hypothetical protein
MSQSSPPRVLAWLALLVTTVSLLLCLTIATEVYAMVLAPTPSECWLSCPDRWTPMKVERLESTPPEPAPARTRRPGRSSKKRQHHVTACATGAVVPACS